MKKLLSQIKNWQGRDIDESSVAKLLFEPKAGDWVEIYWTDREFPDCGYIFTLPEQDIDLLDCCIHVPQMDNSDGIGYGEEIHIHMFELLYNERVEQIVKKTPQ